MPAVDFGARMKEAEKAGIISSGDYLKLKEGANRFRLVSECLAHEGEFKGQRNFKWLCLVIDRNDGRVKPFFMPHTIYKQIVALQRSDDYAFDGVPMPYDLTISADGAGTKEVKYSLMPARKESQLTQAENEAITAHKTVQDVKKALDEKKGNNGKSNGHVGGMTDEDYGPHPADSEEPF
jgi:hypothetical protein